MLAAANSPRLTAAVHAGDQAAHYWEQRARRFATEGDALAAVCSYGMPAFYNRAIHRCQQRALAPWLHPPAGTKVLEVGCGVGRWSLELARRGARVTGVDVSPTMITQARSRALLAGVGERCRFLVQDLVSLDLGATFDIILSVTVLQHILEPAALQAAVRRLVAHLAPGGRLVLLEAAPLRAVPDCDSPVFCARQRHAYLRLLAENGLQVRTITGVDPAPFRVWLLPHLSRLPRRLRPAALAITTALSIPIDRMRGRAAVRRSWHAVFIAEHARDRHEH